MSLSCPSYLSPPVNHPPPPPPSFSLPPLPPLSPVPPLPPLSPPSLPSHHRQALQHLSHLLPDPATLLLSTNLLFHANTHPPPTFFIYLSLAPLLALHHRHALQHLARLLPDPAALPLSTGLLFHLLSHACLCAMPRSSLLFLFQPAAHRLTRDVGLEQHLLPPPIPHVHVGCRKSEDGGSLWTG
ncbi:unnamed protein product [Closterium sp. Naga37s-1]|nr:unnamed protein product [Closterium sp. Naga37s-1]